MFLGVVEPAVMRCGRRDWEGWGNEAGGKGKIGMISGKIRFWSKADGLHER